MTVTLIPSGLMIPALCLAALILLSGCVVLWRRQGPMIPLLLAGLAASIGVYLLGPLTTPPAAPRTFDCQWDDAAGSGHRSFRLTDSGDHLHGSFSAGQDRRKGQVAVAGDDTLTFTFAAARADSPPDLVVVIDGDDDEMRPDVPRAFRALGILVGDDPLNNPDDFTVEGQCVQATEAP
ncbi:hypothetical protein [Novispirillum itersonii]|uniref:Uncharacterized protein n=1 Tax=Novispirillum itersonii TaxID=189 RepID=A0A7X0DM14_NOVIT|nr:hypothetical protein [Novispirillum itersonii]MBB6210570.1 hypothetical protein [Novispirillum itersonii]